MSDRFADDGDEEVLDSITIHKQGKVGDAPLASVTSRLAERQEIKAPHYRPADDAPVMSCKTCSFSAAGHCRPFDFETDPTFICDVWAAVPIAMGDRPGTKGFPPGPIDGDKPLDMRFDPDAAIQDVGTQGP